MEEEKIYYKDDHVKVTNLRITANHITVPIQKVAHVTTEHKVTEFSLSFAAFVLSFVFFYWYTNPICVTAGVACTVVTLIWCIQVYKSYVELILNIDGNNLTILQSSMGNKEYIYKIADAMVEPIIEEKKMGREKELLDEDSASLNLSETLKLRMLLSEKQESALKNLKNQINPKDDKKEG